jgi:hypothetical protein
MKTRILSYTLLMVLTAYTAVAEKITAGPKGGRLLDSEPHKAEFFVTPERKVEITFYDASMKPVAAAAQNASVTAELSGGKTDLPLEKAANGFISKDPLPAGEPYRVVVQIRAAPESRPKNFRLDLNLATCAECNHAEYACTCEGH